MSIMEYEAKFSELAHYTLALVGSESMKCLKFQEGLKSNIKRSVVVLRLHNFNDLVAAAICVEQDNAFYYRGREEAKVPGGPQRNDKKDQNLLCGQASAPPVSGSSSSSGSGRSRPYDARCHF